MLEEAVEVIRALHTGRTVTHRGAHYTVEEARIYTRPDGPIPIYVSAFGPLAARLAGRAGDGLCTTIPDPGLVRTFRESGGGDKPVQGGMKVCWAPLEDEGVATAHRLWRNELLPGAIALVMPEPKDFEAATELVTVDMMRGHLPCGPDPQRHIDQVKVYEEAGFDELYVQQIGPDQEGFLDAWATHVLPKI